MIVILSIVGALCGLWLQGMTLQGVMFLVGGFVIGACVGAIMEAYA